MCSSNAYLYLLIATLTLPIQFCGCGLLTSVLVCMPLKAPVGSSGNMAWPAVLVHVRRLLPSDLASCAVVVYQPLCRTLD